MDRSYIKAIMVCFVNVGHTTFPIRVNCCYGSVCRKIVMAEIIFGSPTVGGYKWSFSCILFYVVIKKDIKCTKQAEELTKWAVYYSRRFPLMAPERNSTVHLTSTQTTYCSVSYLLIRLPSYHAVQWGSGFQTFSVGSTLRVAIILSRHP